MASKLLRIHGKVQGVYYRDNTVAMARAAGVAGWALAAAQGAASARASKAGRREEGKGMEPPG